MITGYGKDIVSTANTLSAIADETVLKNGHMVITAVYINSANDLEAIAYKSWDTGSEWVIGHGLKARRDADGTLQVWWANGSYGFRSEADAMGFLRGEVTRKRLYLKSANGDAMNSLGEEVTKVWTEGGQ